MHKLALNLVHTLSLGPVACAMFLQHHHLAAPPRSPAGGGSVPHRCLTPLEEELVEGMFEGGVDEDTRLMSAEEFLEFVENCEVDGSELDHYCRTIERGTHVSSRDVCCGVRGHVATRWRRWSTKN